MTVHPVLLFLGGLVVVLLGAELLLRGATRIAAKLGIKPIIIGLTVVAIGTSMPELAVGVAAVQEGRGPMAVGNIAGTNIVNILLILGLSAAIRPLPLQLLSIRLDVPVMIASAIALIVIAWDGVLRPSEGLVLVGAAVVYFTALIILSRRESAEMRKEFAEEYDRAALAVQRGWQHVVWNIVLLVVGIALTLLGADLLVAGAARIAYAFGVSDAIVGLTIVAIGTSAPELATTVVATYRDDRDVAVGNLLGSSITNILVILGLTCAVSPDGVAVSRDVQWIDLPLAALVAIACLPVFRSDRMVSRREGLVFVAAYLLYLGLLVLRA